MITAHQGIAIAEHILWCRLTKIQRLIFYYAWDEKSYGEIAKLTNHTEGYIKNAAAELWHLLSAALQTKVTKQNFAIALNRYASSTVYPLQHHAAVTPIEPREDQLLNAG